MKEKSYALESGVYRSSEIVATGANRMRGMEAGGGVGGSEGGGGGGLCDSGGDGGVESDHSRDRLHAEHEVEEKSEYERC